MAEKYDPNDLAQSIADRYWGEQGVHTTGSIANHQGLEKYREQQRGQGASYGPSSPGVTLLAFVLLAIVIGYFYMDANMPPSRKPPGAPPAVPSALPAASIAPGTYSVQGRGTDGRPYTGTVKIESRGNDVYGFQWVLGPRDVYHGVGRVSGRVLTVNFGASDPAIYQVAQDGSLIGTWARGKAQEQIRPR